MRKLPLMAMLMLAFVLSTQNLKAQNTAALIDVNNVYIQSRAEKIDASGWVHFKNSAAIEEGEIFGLQKTALGLGSMDNMNLLSHRSDEQGIKHNKYQQYHNGILVDGAVMHEHLRNCKVFLVNGRVVENLNLSSLPQLSEQQALTYALNYVGATSYAWQDTQMEQDIKEDTGDPTATHYPKGELRITYDPSGTYLASNHALAWFFEIISHTPKKNLVVQVNATTGGIIRAVSNEVHNGPATTLYDGTQTVDSRWSGGLFHGHHHLHTDEGGRNIVTKTGTYNTSWAFLGHIANDGDDTWDAAGQAAGNSAHWVTTQSWDFFKNTYARNGFDNNGSEIRVIGESLLLGNAGAFKKNGMRYIEFGTFTGIPGDLATLDVAGHELTHALIWSEANLDYEGESGALNESFADIFGTMTEKYSRGGAANWLYGDDTGSVLRDIRNPSQSPIPQPETYLTDPLWVPTVGCTPNDANDKCGVHTNSGVQNKWFSLLSLGGTHNSINIVGIGQDKAARIAYHNLCYQLISTSNHFAARAGAIAAARYIFGPCSLEEIQTTNAWAAVGVGAQWSGPCFTIQGDEGICISNEHPQEEYYFEAFDVPGTTFTWSVPSCISSYYLDGDGNNRLVVTGFSGGSYPLYCQLCVTSSNTGETKCYNLIIRSCDSGNPECTDKIVKDRKNGDQIQRGGGEFTISPNPSKDILNLSSRFTPIREVEVYSLAGNFVAKYSGLSTIDHTIDVQYLVSGIYLIRVRDQNGAISTLKFVKI